MIKVIAVDFDGVYFTSGVEKFWMEASAKLGIDYETIKEAQFERIRDFHVQKITEKEYWDSFCKMIGKHVDHTTLRNMFLRHVKPKKPVIELVKRLRKNYKIVLLSNHTVWLDELDRKYDFYRNFDILMSSHIVKVQKPNREIYELLIKKARIKPEEIVFIDDKERNLIPARKMGIKCILFKDVRQLRKELAILGVKA